MKRFRLIAGLAGTTLCLFAISGYAQNTNTPGTTTDPGATGSVSAPQTGTAAGGAQTPAPTSTGGGTVTGTETRTAATDATTTTTTTSFPGGVLGILAVAVLILLVLFALFRGRDRTVVRESSTSSSTAAPSGRVTGSSATADDRVATSRAASGTGTTSGGMNDPNARR